VLVLLLVLVLVLLLVLVLVLLLVLVLVLLLVLVLVLLLVLVPVLAMGFVALLVLVVQLLLAQMVMVMVRFLVVGSDRMVQMFPVVPFDLGYRLDRSFLLDLRRQHLQGHQRLMIHSICRRGLQDLLVQRHLVLRVHLRDRVERLLGSICQHRLKVPFDLAVRRLQGHQEGLLGLLDPSLVR